MKQLWQNKLTAITGGAGFIGSNLAKELVRRGARVRIVDNLERGRLDNLVAIREQVEFIRADLRTPEAARACLTGVDVVFHLAAQVGGIKVYLDKAGSVLNNNLLIDQNVFAAAVELKTPKLFYASSAHVYPGRLQQSPDAPALKEDDADPAEPILTYGWGKRIGEITLLSLAAECPWMNVSIARIMGAYGYNQDITLETGSVIPVFCHRAIIWPERSPFRIWGTGTETRSYVFIDDVVEGILQSMTSDQNRNITGPFNLAAEGRATIRDLANRIVALSGKSIPIELSPSPTAIWGQAADCSFATGLLNGWHAQVSLDDGLSKTYSDIRRQLSQSGHIR
jgi:GDP-D-mannose 3', 5'-epimerase